MIRFTDEVDSASIDFIRVPPLGGSPIESPAKKSTWFIFRPNENQHAVRPRRPAGGRGGVLVFFFAGRPGRDGVVFFSRSRPAGTAWWFFFAGPAWPGRRVDFYSANVPKINTPVVYFGFQININTPSAPKINTPPERWHGVLHFGEVL